MRSGLEALGRLMRRPEVRDSVIASRIQIEAASRQIGVLRGFKDLHDQLHRLDLEFFNHVSLEIEGFPADPQARRHVAASRATLDEVLHGLRAVAGRAVLEAEETDWIERSFAPAHADLLAAIERSDRELFRNFLGALRTLLMRQPMRIDGLLYGAAKALRLPDLVQALRAVCDELGGPELDPEPVRRFEQGVAALAALNQILARLLTAHHLWQEVDLDLHLIDFSGFAQQQQLELSWPDLDERLGSFGDADLAADRRQLTDALAERNPRKIAEAFLKCRHRAGLRFFQVDCDLKSLCDELGGVAAPLGAVLEMMR